MPEDPRILYPISAYPGSGQENQKKEEAMNNPPKMTLWRYARALGRQLVLAHAEPAAAHRNGKASGSGRKTRAKEVNERK